MKRERVEIPLVNVRWSSPRRLGLVVHSDGSTPEVQHRSTPLQLTWTHDPVKILGIHFSYDEKQNNYHNFAIKIQILQTNLDLWKSRNLTLFGKGLIIKSIGLSQLVYLASNLNVPIDFTSDTQKKLFSFFWKNKKDKIKGECVYEDYEKGGIRMPNLDFVLKALRLAWLPRLLNPVKQNWKSIPYHFFRKFGGLNFFVKMQLQPKVSIDPKLPIFMKIYCLSSSKLNLGLNKKMNRR